MPSSSALPRRAPRSGSGSGSGSASGSAPTPAPPTIPPTLLLQPSGHSAWVLPVAVSALIVLLFAVFTLVTLMLVRQARERTYFDMYQPHQHHVYPTQRAPILTVAIAATGTEASEHVQALAAGVGTPGVRSNSGNWPDRGDARGRHSRGPVYSLPVERVWEDWYASSVT